jgi:hypothetical protein
LKIGNTPLYALLANEKRIFSFKEMLELHKFSANVVHDLVHRDGLVFGQKVKVGFKMFKHYADTLGHDGSRGIHSPSKPKYVKNCRLVMLQNVFADPV